jgi:RHS repeat-associated protein
LFLQEVNYYYDKTGRLIRINDPGQMECYQDEEYCRLYVEFCVLTEIREVDCNPLTSLDIGGQSYPVNPPLDLMDLNSSPILQSLIAEALDYYGYTGSVTVVSYKQGKATCYEITITNSNAPVIQFKSNVVVCAQTLQQECCSREVPDNGGGGTSGQANNFDLFYEKIDYDGLDISRIEYTSDCRTGKMRNDYTYDKNHRVTLQDNTIFNPERQDDWYTASFTYDAAGNILTLKRNGMFGPQPGQQTYVPIDDLLYEYDLNTPGVKQLKSIDDLLQGDPQPLGFKPDILYYGYDGNGNMLSSQHGTVTWNVINMPVTAAIPGGEMNFDYTFSGEKTRMQMSGDETEDRLYLGGAEFVFDPDAGIYLPDNYQHEEGRWQYRNDDYEQEPKPNAMQYQITDHLGNLAVLFSDANNDGHVTSENETSDPDEIEVLQRHFYYPFGMDMDGTWLRVKPYEDRYRYNHKELTKGLGWYAYGARYYDAAIGRFAGVDPIGDRFAWVSTYNYAENEPVANIDLWGLQKLSVVKGVNFAEFSDPQVNITTRANNTRFTTSALQRNTSSSITVNTQQYEAASLGARATAAFPGANSNWLAQGLSIENGQQVSGRSSSGTFFMAQNYNDDWAFGAGDPPSNSKVAIGGGIPVIINGLPYGETNVYSSDAPSGLPQVGDPGAGNRQFLLQRSNAGYPNQNNSTIGKVVLGYSTVH